MTLILKYPKRKTVSTFPNAESSAKNTTRSEVFLMTFNLFGNVTKPCFTCTLFTQTIFVVIQQTRETVFHRDIQTPRRELKIRRVRSGVFLMTFNLFGNCGQTLSCVRSRVFFICEIRGDWITNEILSQGFDISSQSKLELRRKRGNKIYAN